MPHDVDAFYRLLTNSVSTLMYCCNSLLEQALLLQVVIPMAIIQTPFIHRSDENDSLNHKSFYEQVRVIEMNHNLSLA